MCASRYNILILLHTFYLLKTKKAKGKGLAIALLVHESRSRSETLYNPGSGS